MNVVRNVMSTGMKWCIVLFVSFLYYRSNLFSLVSRARKRPASDIPATDCSSHVNYKFLEKVARLYSLQKKSRPYIMN